MWRSVSPPSAPLVRAARCSISIHPLDSDPVTLSPLPPPKDNRQPSRACVSSSCSRSHLNLKDTLPVDLPSGIASSS